MLLPIERVEALLRSARAAAPLDEATELLLTEIRARLRFLVDVGLSYLTLDRQSRTLSGGEVQRINLTTALGTSLVNTLFVLDEPSIGLHPRDMNRVIGVMKRLRDAGNSLVVVEHDPQVMFAADRMLDIGPGPGERGGQIVYWGAGAELRAPTLTGDYLSAAVSIPSTGPRRSRRHAAAVLEGAREHNLRRSTSRSRSAAGVPDRRVGQRQVDADAGRAAAGAAKAKGKPSERPAPRRLLGDDWLDDVVFVDQSPIGKTTRSNPVSYVGAFDAIRKRFAKRPVARSAATPPAPSASTPATAAARPAAATASSTSRCSSCPTCTCAAPTATASAYRPRSSRSRSSDTAGGERSVADVLD
jgi:excinuclease ABC subunit A